MRSHTAIPSTRLISSCVSVFSSPTRCKRNQVVIDATSSNCSILSIVCRIQNGKVKCNHRNAAYSADDLNRRERLSGYNRNDITRYLDAVPSSWWNLRIAPSVRAAQH
eukprot:PhF_6_TR36382/c0_g1_i3/m.53467